MTIDEAEIAMLERLAADLHIKKGRVMRMALAVLYGAQYGGRSK